MRRLLPFPPVLLAVCVAVLPVARADEEEEVTPKKPTKKIVVDDDTPGGATAIPDVVRAAGSAKHPALKKYFASVGIACDRVQLSRGRVLRVALLPFVWDKDGKEFQKNPDGFGVTVLDENNRPANDATAVLPKDVRGITPFEWQAVQETNRLIESTSDSLPPLPDRLVAAERALSAVLFKHTSEVESNRRRGPNWEFYKTALADKLLDVRLALVKEVQKARDWPRLAELVARYADIYKSKPKVVQEVMAARLPEAMELVKSSKLADLERSRDILAEYEGRYPDSGNDTAKAIKVELGKRTQELISSAASADKDTARTLLNKAKLLTPDDPAVIARQKELKAGYSVLVVGVNRMPRLMSPATAREDSERMAVELLFEGLYEALPDEAAGRTFRAAAAGGKPGVLPLARVVPLGGGIDPADLAATVQLMKASRGLPSAEAADWIADCAADPARPETMVVKFSSAHPDPRELLTFKLLPGQHLLSKKKTLEDQIGGQSFARSPFGTGPFRLAPDFVPASGDTPVPAISFVPNPAYGRRLGRIGQPELSEVRFVPVAGLKAEDLARQVSGEVVHVVPDVPTSDLVTFQNAPNVSVVTPAENRRVYILAVNHTAAEFGSADVRRGIAHAIDRDTILAEVFRAGTTHHKPLAGPFPAGSWLDPTAAKPLFDPDLARVKMKGASGRAELLYPNDDPRAEAACKAIARQISECGTLVVTAVKVSAVDLRNRVERRGDYQLAYLPFDYPDVWHAHALTAALDPTAATEGGRNLFRFRAKGAAHGRPEEALADALTELTRHRDSEGEVKKLSKEVRERFGEAMPFVPLWQLDRHMAVSTAVRVWFDGRGREPTVPSDDVPAFAGVFSAAAAPQLDGRASDVPYDRLDPITLFANPGRWKLDTK